MFHKNNGEVMGSQNAYCGTCKKVQPSNSGGYCHVCNRRIQVYVYSNIIEVGAMNSHEIDLAIKDAVDAVEKKNKK